MYDVWCMRCTLCECCFKVHGGRCRFVGVFGMLGCSCISVLVRSSGDVLLCLNGGVLEWCLLVGYNLRKVVCWCALRSLRYMCWSFCVGFLGVCYEV